MWVVWSSGAQWPAFRVPFAYGTVPDHADVSPDSNPSSKIGTRDRVSLATASKKVSKLGVEQIEKAHPSHTQQCQSKRTTQCDEC